ncbi:MAG: hypothetical protein NC299_16470 [Lachnospiraceae bacterium]|nr:hypothetical protein [Ruminococcus sp.]MCM1167356.1 hypothetical protein [Ruminococcus sp.]MCM1276849.1 hypothetical protein [Lachnospiraceae bacterium]MCM1276931.1 hypothetical protein [Lachnospiraceae bacterium]
MTFFENELKKMFGNNSALTDIRYVGNALVGRLTDDTIAKISFKTGDVHGKFESALVQIINTKTGEIDRQSLNFRDTLGITESTVYAWEYRGEVSWYGFKPSERDYESMNQAAEQYLEMFLEPVQDMRLSM